MIYKLNHHCVFSPPLLLVGGDTPFCAFGNEIKDFYLTRKKLVAATYGVKNYTREYVIHVYLPISHASQYDATLQATSSHTTIIRIQ